MTPRDLISEEPKQAISEPEQGVSLEKMPGASGRNGLVPPAEHRFLPGRSGNPKGRPRRAVTAKQLRKMARQLTPGAVQRLVELVGSHDDKVALGASLALLERGYGKPVSELEVERHVQWEAEEAERRRTKATRHATLETARANLVKQWETMTPEQRKARLLNLGTESGVWAERDRWVEAQMEGGYDIDWLAGGGVPKYETL